MQLAMTFGRLTMMNSTMSHVMTEVFLVRHGEAHCNVVGLAGGEKTCTGPTERGRQQVSRLAGRLRYQEDSGAPFDVIFATPCRRVRESAEILAATLELPVHIEPALRCLRYGQADGDCWDNIEPRSVVRLEATPIGNARQAQKPGTNTSRA
jgi:probable phosphoglycerate mutase